MLIEPIGTLSTPFTSKLLIPRQSSLLQSTQAYIKLFPPYQNDDATSGLLLNSHLRVLTWMHAAKRDRASMKVRPPRLGGNKNLGVFATRSPYRPNPIGLSLSQIIDIKSGVITIAGIDMLDGTPVLDIKPCIPYSDQVDCTSDLAKEAPVNMTVLWSMQALLDLKQQGLRCPLLPIQNLVNLCLAQAPKPAYQNCPERIYGASLWDIELKWRCLKDHVEVVSLEKTKPS